MRKEQKILEEGESTYKNGGCSVCGGIVSQSLFDSNPMAYMMAYYMEDKYFNQYAELKKSGKDKEAKKVFDKYARSAI